MSGMRLATWNVNSIRARLPLVLRWLETTRPDVLAMQEIKCETEAFPAQAFEALGYHACVVGQKAYNGVALLSKTPLRDVMERLPGDETDAQARYLEATTGDGLNSLRIASLYVPNGNPIDTDKFAYKLAWLSRLRAQAQTLLATERPFILAGDFNVIPSVQDVVDPKGWEQDALYHPQTRSAYRALLHLGLTDAFRALHPDQRRAFTFWDYQGGSWQNDNGLRIDHVLLSPQACDRLTGCFIDKTPRGLEQPSDHTPVVAVFEL